MSYYYVTGLTAFVIGLTAEERRPFKTAPFPDLDNAKDWALNYSKASDDLITVEDENGKSMFVCRSGREERRVYYGLRDKVNRGIVSIEDARSRVWQQPGYKFPDHVEPAGPPDPYEVAAEFKRKGIPRDESWSRWIQRTNLSPGMDAKDWYKIFDNA